MYNTYKYVKDKDDFEENNQRKFFVKFNSF